MNNLDVKQIQHHILDLDATDIAALIRNGELTSEQCTITFIDQIKSVNPQLNAVVEERFQKAIEEAKEYDERISHANFDLQPLYGVPISIKESLHVNGMKTTGGLIHRSDIIMSQNADAVQCLLDAGAIILCKTNTPSLCFCQETDNKLYGKTNNAWDIKYTAGGSSGGEGALVGIGGSALGLGSDIGGSIRFPSHFNGVVGFKPGKNQVSANGHFPGDSFPLKDRMSGVGPITKSVRDAQLVHQLIAEQGRKKFYYEKMSVDILPIDNGYPISEQTALLMEEVSQYLQQIYQTTWSIPPFFNDTTKVWQEVMSIDGAKDIRQLAFNTDRPNIWKHYLQEKLSRKTATHVYLSWALIGAEMFKPSAKRLKEIEHFITQGDMVLDRHLQNRLLIFPVYHEGASEHGEVYKEIFSLSKTYMKYLPYITYANVWGLPSLTIPIGFDKRNMPIGLQIMSATCNEDAIFELGKLLEDYFGGYVRSNYYDKH